MATSPREELVITSIVVFGRFEGGWVWDEINSDSSSVTDSGHKAFGGINEAVADFLDDRGIDITKAVDPADAHYSDLIKITPDDLPAEEYHIRKYKYGAPDPLQVTT